MVRGKWEGISGIEDEDESEVSGASKTEGWLEECEKYCQFEVGEVEEEGYGSINSWKTIFLETKISLESRSKSTDPLKPDLYPKKTHFLALGCYLVLWAWSVEA